MHFLERILVALNDPTKMDLIKLLLEDHKKIPKTFKYIVAWMKFSPSINDLILESIKSRSQDSL